MSVEFLCLPPYAPELDLLEPLWREVKCPYLDDLSYPTGVALKEAVDNALIMKAEQLLQTREDLPLAA